MPCSCLLGIGNGNIGSEGPSARCGDKRGFIGAQAKHEVKTGRKSKPGDHKTQYRRTQAKEESARTWARGQ